MKARTAAPSTPSATSPKVEIFPIPDSIRTLRIVVSRVVVTALLLLLIVSKPFFRGEGLEETTENLGLILVVFGTLGRIWSGFFIAGRKERELVTTGPYSLVRNPLYFFSLFAALGIGFGSQSIVITVVLGLAFALYYPYVIRSEERALLAIHGERFAKYLAEVPRLFPRFSGYCEPEELTVRPRSFRRAMLDSMWFFWIFLIIRALVDIRAFGFMPWAWHMF